MYLDSKVPFVGGTCLVSVANALRMLQVVTDSVGKPTTAKELCLMILQLAYDVSCSNPVNAESLLRELGLVTSEHVGNSVYEMIRLGYMKESENDSRSDFDNLYDLDQPTSTWAVCWTLSE